MTVKRAEVIKVVGNLIKYGINMDNYNVYQCNLFLKELCNFLNETTTFSAIYSDNKVTIESVFFDPIVIIELDKTTIHCIPVTDEGWIDAVFEIIKFMHIREGERREKAIKKKKREQEDNKEFDWI